MIFFGILNSSKNERIQFDLRYHITNINFLCFFVLGLEELEIPKSSFEIKWPLVTLNFLLIVSLQFNYHQKVYFAPHFFEKFDRSFSATLLSALMSVQILKETVNKIYVLKIIKLYQLNKHFYIQRFSYCCSSVFLFFSCLTRTTQNKNTFYHYIFCGTPALDPPHSHSKAWTLLTFYLLRRHEYCAIVKLLRKRCFSSVFCSTDLSS